MLVFLLFRQAFSFCVEEFFFSLKISEKFFQQYDVSHLSYHFLIHLMNTIGNSNNTNSSTNNDNRTKFSKFNKTFFFQTQAYSLSFSILSSNEF